ncbi:DUF3500 domain-containing protein [Rhizobium rhizogenes]|uniref:DUF3500 domain-containing protein n=1 Tax=Rhizobium rhizogenes TaxID=359 RepID=UPI001574497C|nr:DUF3500 domain-containing protein [Rhizobium rhizogenes]NTF97918.1 DUF3500 domain-containing protein [Rhizobium rhizogenes]
MAGHQKTLTPLSDEKMKAAFGVMSHPRDFRPFVPPKAPPALNSPRGQRTREVSTHGSLMKEIHEFWSKLLAEPFLGVTTDGVLRPLSRELRPNGAPRTAMDQAGRRLLEVLSPEILARVHFALNAPQWRRWHNMPLLWERDGIGLEEMNAAERTATLELVRASVSAEGYRHIIELMQINRFSGELIGREKYLNEFCYSFGLFGVPGDDDWGWQLYGHHLCLNCRLVEETYVLSPTFLAAEPTVVDEGSAAGIDAFVENERAALALMQNLPDDLRRKAVTLESILTADMPKGRRHWADSLHLAGAFRDNRVMPLEGVCACDFRREDRQRLMALLETFFLLLPPGPKAARMAEMEAHLDQTWLCWMGGWDDWAPFYFRIHSPALIAEYDCHQAVFLTNAEPARFHVHTITRIPEGGDYGMDLAARLKEASK